MILKKTLINTFNIPRAKPIYVVLIVEVETEREG
jgi:hypothetical protein